MSDTDLTVGDKKVAVTEKVFDHGVDGICAMGICATAYVGAADMTVVAGLVSIALGKRVLKSVGK